MSDGDLFDTAKSMWQCPRCDRKFPTVDHRHSWTSALGAIIECEKATPVQIAEYKKFCEAREIRRKAAREDQARLEREEQERISREAK